MRPEELGKIELAPQVELSMDLLRRHRVASLSLAIDSLTIATGKTAEQLPVKQVLEVAEFVAGAGEAHVVPFLLAGAGPRDPGAI